MTTALMTSTPVLPKATSGIVVCLATGESLCQQDVDYCRGRASVIAVNDAWRMAPWADVLYSSDVRWWRHYGYAPDFQGVRVGLTYHGLPDVKQWHESFPGLLLTVEHHEGLERREGYVSSTKNSGGAAINLAVHMGARRVVLLGYDMQGQHFFGAHPGPIRRSSSFESFRQYIGTMVEPLQQAGVEVVNCSRKTALEHFPVRALRDVL
jgi:hypothetical protein